MHDGDANGQRLDGGAPPPAERADGKDSASSGATSCPDCASTDLAVISEGEFVTIYKCPRCGKLLAPVKHR